jgi:hypothetical protein
MPFTQTETYLAGLLEKTRARNRRRAGRKLTYYKDRPKTIDYRDGTSVELENDPSHPEYDHFDRISIRTPRGRFCLNGRLPVPVFFFDTGYAFELQHPVDEQKYYIIYGSMALRRTKRNLYTLLHEFSHVADEVSGTSRRPKIDLEPAMWKKADGLAAEMGLEMFEDEQERILYRDIFLRSYDQFNEHEITESPIMLDITAERFGFDVLRGLMEAAASGRNLSRLCQRLVREKSR